MADVVLQFRSESRQAAQNLSKLRDELKGLAAAGGDVGERSRRAFASIESSSNDARREILRLRERYQELGRQIAENNRIAASADAATRTRLRESNRQLRVQQQLIQVESRRASLSLANLTQEKRELRDVVRETERLSRAKGRASGAGSRFSSVISGIGAELGALGLFTVIDGVQTFTREMITSATTVEGYMHSLTALYGTSERAAQALRELDAAADSPGLTFDQAVQGAIRLGTVGVVGERATRILKEFGNIAALSGAGAEQMGRAITGLTQTLSRGQIEQDNLNQILENVPSIGAAIREEFGSIDAEQIRDALDTAGESVDDFVDRLTRRLGEGARAPVDSTRNAIDNLRNEIFRLQVGIGEGLLPTLNRGIVALTNFLSAIRSNDLSSLPAPIQAIVRAAQDLLSRLRELYLSLSSQVSPEIREAVTNIGSLLASVLRLAGSLATALSPAFVVVIQWSRVVIALIAQLADGLGNLIDGITTAVEWLTFWRDKEEEVSKSADKTGDSVKLLTGETNTLTQARRENVEATQATADAEKSVQQATAATAEELVNLQGALRHTNTELERNRQRYQELIAQGASPAHPAMLQLSRTIERLSSASEQGSEKVKVLQNSLLGVESPITDADRATRVFRQTLDETENALSNIDTRFDSFRARAQRLVDAIRELPPEITHVREELELLTPFTEQINEHFDDLPDNIHDAAAEMLVLRGISRALTTELTSIAADTTIANAEFRLVSFEVAKAVAALESYTNTMAFVGVTYRELEDIQQDVISATRTQSSAFDKLRGVTDNLETSLDELSENAFRKLEIAGVATADATAVAFEEAAESIRTAFGIVLEELSLRFEAFNGELGTLEGFQAGFFDPIVSALTSGNPFNLLQIPFNIYDNFQAQEDRRRQAIAEGRERDFYGDENLRRVFRSLFGDTEQAPEFDFARNYITSFDTSGHNIAAEGVSQRILDLIANEIAGLVTNLPDTIIQASDIQAVFATHIDALGASVENFAYRVSETARSFSRLGFSVDGVETELEGLSEDIGQQRDAINAFYNLQERALLEAQQASGISTFEERQRLDRQRVETLRSLARNEAAIRDNLLSGQNQLLRNSIEIQRFNLNAVQDADAFQQSRESVIDSIKEYYDAERDRLSRLTVGIDISQPELENRLTQLFLQANREIESVQNFSNAFIDLNDRLADALGEINVSLGRSIEDINRDAARRIEDLEDDPRLGARTNARRRREAIARIERDAARREEDARIQAARREQDLNREFEARRAELEAENDARIATANEMRHILEDTTFPIPDWIQALLDPTLTTTRGDVPDSTLMSGAMAESPEEIQDPFEGLREAIEEVISGLEDLTEAAGLAEEELRDISGVDLGNFVEGVALGDHVSGLNLPDFVSGVNLPDFVEGVALGDYVSGVNLAGHVSGVNLGVFVEGVALGDHVSGVGLADHIIGVNLPDHVSGVNLPDFVSGVNLGDFVKGVNLGDFVSGVNLAIFIEPIDLNDHITPADINTHITPTDLNTHVSGVALPDFVSGVALPDFVSGVALADYVSGVALADYVSGVALTDYVSGVSLPDFVVGVNLADYVVGVNLADFVSSVEIQIPTSITPVETSPTEVIDVISGLSDSVTGLSDSVMMLPDSISGVAIQSPTSPVDISHIIEQIISPTPSLSVQGVDVGGEQSPQGVEITVNTDVNLDGERVARNTDKHMAQLAQSGRSRFDQVRRR